MEFRDLRRQYEILQQDIDAAINKVILSGKFISGPFVNELEECLADYVGCKYCITCANGTDALELALRTMQIGKGDIVFVPDFTFFASGEVVPIVGATPMFVDVETDTYNICAESLEAAIQKVLLDGRYVPKAIIAVDLFGQPADYVKLSGIAQKYGLYIIEDGAQGFGGAIGNKKACSFGDIATTSFFPAKPLGCYGDGGAVFTDNEEWNEKIRSLCVHGKSAHDKYDNIHIGMNSRLDSIQAAILMVKFKAFKDKEIALINQVATKYSDGLKEIVDIPCVKKGYESSWAQYTIKLKSKAERSFIQKALLLENIPTMIYYPKPLHMQEAFIGEQTLSSNTENSSSLSEKVLSLPISPYITAEECNQVIQGVWTAVETYRKHR